MDIYGTDGKENLEQVEEKFAEGATEAEKIYSKCELMVPLEVPIDSKSVSYALTERVSSCLYGTNTAFDSGLILYNNMYIINISNDLSESEKELFATLDKFA